MNDLSKVLSGLAVSLYVIPPIIDCFNDIMSEMAESIMGISPIAASLILATAAIVGIASERY